MRWVWMWTSSAIWGFSAHERHRGAGVRPEEITRMGRAARLHIERTRGNSLKIHRGKSQLDSQWRWCSTGAAVQRGHKTFILGDISYGTVESPGDFEQQSWMGDIWMPLQPAFIIALSVCCCLNKVFSAFFSCSFARMQAGPCTMNPCTMQQPLTPPDSVSVLPSFLFLLQSGLVYT